MSIKAHKSAWREDGKNTITLKTQFFDLTQIEITSTAGKNVYYHKKYCKKKIYIYIYI